MEAKNLVGGLLTGVAIGVAIGVLMAPSSGKQTRKKIADGSKDLLDQSMDVVNELKSSVQDTVNSLRTQYNNTIEETANRGKKVLADVREHAKV